MNAQEALAYIEPRLKEWCDYRESHSDVWHDNKNAQDYEALFAIKQLIDQSNAKPKTLEELGWIKDVNGIEITGYSSGCKHIYFDEHINTVRVYTELSTAIISTILQPEEILAIAEKMKELGMTNE